MSTKNPIIEAYLNMFKQPDVVAEPIVDLTETTVPEELQHIPASWDHHDRVSDDTAEKIKKAMTHGSFTHFPLDHNGADIDPDLAEHLTTHGYQVKDYGKGIVTKKIHAGDVKREKWVDSDITSVLNKTKAHPSLISDYAKAKADQEKAAKNPQLHVVVSTSPLAIAGMTTGTEWRNKSCMNMEGGSHSNKLRDDSETGTHVAFLVPHDDVTAFKYGEPSKPIARIALKPFHEIGGGSHKEYKNDTIFRPERVTYGSGSNSFTNAVSQWASEKYPAKIDTEYEKNSSVYDDTGETTYKTMSTDDVEKKLKKDHFIVDVQGQSTDKHVIDHAVDYVTKNLHPSTGESDYAASRAVKNISRVGNLTTEHVAKLHRLLKDHLAVDPNRRDAYERGFSDLANAHGDKFSTKAIEEYHSDMAMESPERLPGKILMSHKLPSKIIDTLQPNQFSFVRRSLIKPHHVDKLVDMYISGAPRSIDAMFVLKDLVNKDHINKIAHSIKESQVYTTVSGFADHPEFSKEAHDAVMNKFVHGSPSFKANSSYSIAANDLMEKSRHATLDDAHKIPSKMIMGSLMANPHLQESEALKLKNEVVRRVNSSDEAHTISLSHVPGFSRVRYIPETVSKHFTDADYQSLAKKRMTTAFENVHHSNKYLDNQYDVAKHYDNLISEHVNKKTNENSKYNPAFDAHAQNLKDQLDRHVSAFSHVLTTHIFQHIQPEDDGDYPKDIEETKKTLKRLQEPDFSSDRSIENLKNYDNKSDHFLDHFQDDIDNLHNLIRTTKY